MKQIQTQNQKNLSKINFGISKKEEIKDSIRNLEKIRHLDNEEPIKQALRYIFALIGLKADQIPGDVEKIVLINFIKDNYQNNCPSELKIAFELAIKGEFEADLNHYGSFSALYLSKIFNNYLDYRRNIVLEMQREEEEIQKKKREEYENRPEVIEKRKKDFDKNVLLALFNAYKEDGILDTGLIPCSIVYKSLKERHGLFDLSQEEKQKILNEAKTLDDLPTHNEAFLSAMKRIMDSLLQQPPKMRVQHAETLIANLESIIDQALSGLPDSQGRRM